MMHHAIQAMTLAELIEQDRELAATAHHEAGHTVAAAALGRYAFATAITKSGGGSIYFARTREHDGPEVLEREMIVIASGPIAEIESGLGLGGSQGDEDDLRRLALRLHGLRSPVAARAASIELARSRACVLVDRYWQRITETAELLLRFTALCAPPGEQPIEPHTLDEMETTTDGTDINRCDGFETRGRGEVEAARDQANPE